MNIRKTITDDVFDAVHDKGVTNRRIAILLNCSEATVSRLLKCETFDSYKNYDYDNKLKRIYVKEEQKNVQTPVYASYAQMERMSNTLDSILTILKKYLEV